MRPELKRNAQGVVKFRCEVSAEGKAGHISTLCGKGQDRFAAAVENALRRGRFNPATLDGKPTTVMLGGTVLFVVTNGQPTIELSLAAREGDKVAATSNYVQPQTRSRRLPKKVLTLILKRIKQAPINPKKYENGSPRIDRLGCHCSQFSSSPTPLGS